jgi:hypothetical protein
MHIRYQIVAIIQMIFKGCFVRVVDAVKGPYYPSPPPFPTYLEPVPAEPKEPATYQDYQIYAPVSEKDKGIFKVPDDPY